VALETTKINIPIFELQAEISKTLANPLRLAILHILKNTEKTVNELADLTGVNQSKVSQHLALMRRRQIVITRKAGTSVYYSISSPKISQTCDMMQQVLLEQLKQKQEQAKKYLLQVNP
jgi:DNA-binding transcriptional ArsR family regulator